MIHVDMSPYIKKSTDSVAVFSGGLDSTTLVYDMLDDGFTPFLVSFDYGQRHNKEITYAKNTGKNLGLPHEVIDLRGITHLISNSALTSQGKGPKLGYSISDQPEPWQKPIEVPEGHYAEDSMKATVVPNRNMMMLSIAGAIAVNNKARTIGIGVHAGDHFVYPDCRPEFIFSVGMALLQGNTGFHNFNLPDQKGALPLYAPFLEKSKADIAYRALELAVPLHLTWSCYKGGEKHCGRCGTCVERLEAIDEAIIRYTENTPRPIDHMQIDSTEYEDNEFWKSATMKADLGEDE